MANREAGSLPPAAAAAPSRVQRLRTMVWPEARQGRLGRSALFSAQFWLDESIGRPAGFWGVVAGVLATGILAQDSALDGKTLVLLVLLADVLWGGIWRLAGGRAELLTLPGKAATNRVWLPYLQADSPAARLFGGDNTDIWPLALRTGLPVFFLALMVAAVLGLYAVVLTVAVAVVAGLAWTARRTFGMTPALLLSLAATGLPWVLTALTLTTDQVEGQWLAHLLFAGLWTIHQWGGVRVAGAVEDKLGLALMAATEVAICVSLIILQAPLWLALVVVLLLPTWLLVFKQQSPARVQVLWLAAMLVSASALGQIW
jgi:hypothetical protein